VRALVQRSARGGERAAYPAVIWVGQGERGDQQQREELRDRLHAASHERAEQADIVEPRCETTTTTHMTSALRGWQQARAQRHPRGASARRRVVAGRTVARVLQLGETRRDVDGHLDSVVGRIARAIQRGHLSGAHAVDTDATHAQVVGLFEGVDRRAEAGPAEASLDEVTQSASKQALRLDLHCVQCGAISRDS
jgi:hypothetical protein